EAPRRRERGDERGAAQEAWLAHERRARLGRGEAADERTGRERGRSGERRLTMDEIEKAVEAGRDDDQDEEDEKRSDSRQQRSRQDHDGADEDEEQDEPQGRQQQGERQDEQRDGRQQRRTEHVDDTDLDW